MNYLFIFGGRDLTSYSLVALEVQQVMENWGLTSENTTIVSGGAKGVDSLAETIAKDIGTGLKVMNADWSDMSEPCRLKHNKFGAYNALAGMKRNTEMVELATHAIGFWDGKSKGTEDSIKKVEAKCIPFELVMYQN